MNDEWQQSRHLITEEERKPSSTEFFVLSGLLSGGTVLKVWSKDINCFFFSMNAIGKKRRLYFFHFTHFALMCKCATNTAKRMMMRWKCVRDDRIFQTWIQFEASNKIKEEKELFCSVSSSFLVVFLFPLVVEAAPKFSTKLYIPSWVRRRREKFLRL